MKGVVNHARSHPQIPYGSLTGFGLPQLCSIVSILTVPTSRSRRFRPAFCLKVCRGAKIQVRSRPTSIRIALPTGPDRGRSRTPPRCKGGRTGFSMKRDRVSEGYIVPAMTFILTVRSQGKPSKTIPKKAEIPERYWELLEWYDAWVKPGSAVIAVDNMEDDPLLRLRGSGRHIWADEHADEYVENLRREQ